MDEIAVVQGLQAQIAKLQVTIDFDRRAQFIQVVVVQLFRDQFQLGGFLDVGLQGFGVVGVHVCMGGIFSDAHEAQAFGPDDVHQQACCDLAVVGLFLDQNTGRHDQGGADLFGRNAVVQVTQRVL